MKPIIHCLHQSHRVDRYESMIKQSQDQGFDIMWFEGFRETVRAQVKAAITKGHKSIIQYAADNNFESILIAEDDLIFSGSDGKALQYYISHTPTDYQLYCGCIYAGEVKNNRVMNGASGIMTMFTVHKSYYNFFLNEMPDDCHCDRFCGSYAHQYIYIICDPMVCFQSGGWSDNLQRVMYYNAYLEGKKLYGR